MPTHENEQENELLKAEFESREAGVADLMDFYDAVEGIYAHAAASMYVEDMTYTSNSTDIGTGYADLGRAFTRT